MPRLSDTHAAFSDDTPFRSEVLSAERLAQEAESIAGRQLSTTTGHPRSTPLLPLAKRAAASLLADNRELSAAVRERRATPPAAEWLLDNYYLIEEQLRLVAADLPSDFGRELPRIVAGDFADHPRIYEAFLPLIAHTDARLDETYLLRFVDGFQQSSALSIGETWAVPIMLRLALVENLRRLSTAVVASMRSEQAATEWANRLVVASENDPVGIATLLREVESGPHGRSARFLVRLMQRLGDLDSSVEQVNAWIEQRIVAEGIDLERSAAESQQEQASNQVSIANSITSIRFLDALDWRAFFSRVNVVESILAKDPAQTYAVMDFGSQDRYRHALELIARRSPIAGWPPRFYFRSATMLVDPTSVLAPDIYRFLATISHIENPQRLLKRRPFW